MTTATLTLQVTAIDARIAELKALATSLLAQVAALTPEMDRLDFEAWELECEIEKRQTDTAQAA